MAMYEVRCPKCGCNKEYIAKNIKEVLETKCCTNCGANYEPVVSTCSWSLKGDGWARQGYAKP